MSQKPTDKKKSGGLGAFINSLGDAIDDVVNEVKTDLKAMTPPEQANAKKLAEQAEKQSQVASLLSQSSSGVFEEIDAEADVPTLPPEPDTSRPEPAKPAPTGLPPGNLWQALVNPDYTRRLRTDACYHALTLPDIENYRRAIAAETVAPFTMGLAAIILQAPLEEELEEGGVLVGDDMLLVALLKALEETRLYGAIGAGPRQIWPNLDALDEALTSLLNTHPKLIALGPVGIDEPFAPYLLQKQQEQLALQLDIAADFNLPVILQHRQSLPHLATVLRSAAQLPHLIWLEVIQSEEELALIKEFNMDVVLRPELTTPNFTNAHLYRSIPAEKRLLASGSALVAPHGFSGHFNQPKFLQNTMQAAAKILFVPEAEVTATTNQNLATLFQK